MSGGFSRDRLVVWSGGVWCGVVRCRVAGAECRAHRLMDGEGVAAVGLGENEVVMDMR